MKVILVNGSPHAKGSTYTALKVIADTLEKEGIESTIFQVGDQPIAGCTGCKACATLGRCKFNDTVNDFLEIIPEYDGFIFGSPVHYAAASGALTSFMDRAFYADSRMNRQSFYLKPASSIAAARRAGTTATLDQLNKYFLILQMPIVSSQYWNMVHGTSPEEVMQDEEGIQIMRTLGRNMAFFLKCKQTGLESGVSLPEKEDKIITSFIR